MVKARDEILTEYTGDTRSFDKAARIYERTLARQERLTDQRLTRIDRRHERSSRAILNTTTALQGVGAVLAVRQVRAYAEAWRSVERSLAAIGYEGDDAKKSLVDLALRTRANVNATADAVQRMAKSTGADLDTTVRRVETLQKLLAFGGASGTERASVSLQLGQALKSGQLSGDEFRSISENAPVEFLDALAQAAGISRRELKAFAQDQQLTTDIVLKALDSLASEADEKFGQLAVSGEEAFDTLVTGLKAYVGSLDSSLGATASFNGVLVSLGGYLSESTEGAANLAAAVQILGGAAVAVAGSRGMGALNASFRRAAASRRIALQVAKEEHATHRQTVIDARQKVALAQEERRVRQRNHEHRVFTGQAAKRSAQQVKVAVEAERKAVNVLAGAQVRARASADALTAAQKRLSVATRVTAATQRAFASTLAFFGGPIGLALTAITVTLSVMATRTSEVDRLTEGVRDTVQELSNAYAETGGNVDELRTKLASVSVAQALADAERLERALGKARDAARDRLSQPTFVGIGRKFPELDTLAHLLIEGKKTAGEFRAELNAMVSEGGEGFARLALLYEEILDPLLEATEGTQQANDVLLVLNGTAAEAQAAMKRLGFSFDEAGGKAQTLGDKASAARAGIAGLVALVPELAAAAQAQEKITKATKDRDAALAGLGEQSLWGGREQAQAEKINDLFKRAVSEIDGTAAATRRANKELEQYTSDAHISSLKGREQALAREKLRYDGIVASLKEASATQAQLDQAQAAYQQRVEAINSRKIGGGSGSKSEVIAQRQLADLREILIESGNRSLYIEIALNEERRKLLELVPQLIEAGLTHAEAQAAVDGQLGRVKERLEEVRSASEEAAYSFARGALDDIRHAKSLEDAIGGIRQRLQDFAYDQAFDILANQFAKLAGQTGGGGGLLGSLLGAVFGGGAGSAPSAPTVSGARAAGGPVRKGSAYLVNEDTPRSEIMVASQSGGVLNVPQAQAALASAALAQAAVRDTAGSANVSVSVTPMIHIHNNAKGVEVREERQSNGRTDIYIEGQFSAMLREGRFDSAMRQRYGVTAKVRGG